MDGNEIRRIIGWYVLIELIHFCAAIFYTIFYTACSLSIDMGLLFHYYLVSSVMNIIRVENQVANGFENGGQKLRHSEFAKRQKILLLFSF